MPNKKLVVAKKAEKEIQKGSMLVYSALVKKALGEPKAGELVKLIDENGKFLAQAYYNPKSAAVAQIVSLKEKEKVDEEFYRKKILKAKEFREKALGFKDSYRMFFGESDGIPGLLVDRFNQIAVLQISCPGVELWKKKIAEILLEFDGISTVVERNDSRNRVKLGLPATKGLLAGEKKLQTVVREGKVKFEVDVLRGHKTGFYLDQRENRMAFGDYVGEGDEVLDVFSYTGGFGLHAAVKGAKVTMIDLPEALKHARRNAKLNGVEENAEFVEGQAFEETKKLVGTGKKFDAISCDPPAFVQKKEDLEKGKKAYHQINYNCLKLLKDNAILATSSCSHFLALDDFVNVLASAGAHSGKKLSIIEQRFQARDHLTSMATKKGLYLKCLFLRAIDLK